MKFKSNNTGNVIELNKSWCSISKSVFYCNEMDDYLVEENKEKLTVYHCDENIGDIKEYFEII